MYNTLRQMIERKRFKSLADAEKKLITYHAVDLITEEDLFELLALAREVMQNEQ